MLFKINASICRCCDMKWICSNFNITAACFYCGGLFGLLFILDLWGFLCTLYQDSFHFYQFPTEDSHFKECVGRSPVNKWEMNVG